MLVRDTLLFMICTKIIIGKIIKCLEFYLNSHTRSLGRKKWTRKRRRVNKRRLRGVINTQNT